VKLRRTVIGSGGRQHLVAARHCSRLREPDPRRSQAAPGLSAWWIREVFEEMGNEMEKVDSPDAQDKMKEVMTKYEMELLGPPLLRPLRQQHK
jgi:hypothetical protein